MNPEIRRIEEMSLNAWPALEQVGYDGWLLRFAEGYTGRSNSVQVLDHGTLPVREKVRFCEDEYARRGIPLLFKMTPAARPEGLDELLEGLGYRAFNHTSVQVKNLAADAPDPAPGEGVVPSERVDEAWLSALLAFRPVTDRHVPVLRRILESIRQPAFFALVSDGDRPVACGLGVLEREWVGLFDIVTHPAARRRGHATRTVWCILNWARRRGASRAYLQVSRENVPARRLYEGLAFHEAYGYWYRAKPR